MLFRSQSCKRAIVSIFVNPTQFGPNEDYSRYSRDLDGDTAKLATVGADAIFAPSVEEMYPSGAATSVTVSGLTDGLCGPFRPGHFNGVATVVAKLFDETPEQLAHAYGIAGSMSSGLMEFSKSGGLVKRLHLGRAAEGGFLAAALARDGFTGPSQVLEGKFGSLNTFCRDAQPEYMSKDLGKVWHTMKTKFKRFACHANAQVPVTLAMDLKAKHGFTGNDVASMSLEVNGKSLSHHNIPEPADLAMAQYSVPFSTALALFFDPTDPWKIGRAHV